MSEYAAHTHITLVGYGKMGQALLEGWLNSPINAKFTIIDPQIDKKLENTPLKTHYSSTEDAQSALNTTKMVILAVKPQIMANVCAELKPHIAPDAAIMSIAAGQTIANFERYFSPSQPIIRTMPNTPAAIGKGMSIAVANTRIRAQQKELAEALLTSAGKIEWVQDENLLDAVTAVSGSGPAYVFHLIEILTKSAESAGLTPALAATLARQTVIGAAALAENEPETPAATLRENVTSPGGTTAAALEILMNGEWQDIFDRAIAAAKDRGQALQKP
jgi:pyrroline-5-carboxylate reductase